MAFTFSLDIVVPCACNTDSKSKDSCQNALSNSPINEIGSSKSLLIVSASSVALLSNRKLASTERSLISHLGIFVPPSLLAFTNYLDFGTPTCCEQVRVVTDKSVRETMSSELLSRIHPFLLERGRLVGIVSACRDETAASPADVIIIDVSNAPRHWWHDIKASVNGEPMASAPTAVLKLIPLSSITITAATTNTNLLIQSEIPTCPVCLHRIDPLHIGMPKPQSNKLCSIFCPSFVPDGQHGEECQNQQFLRPWPAPSNCIACHVIHNRHKNYLSLSAADENHDQKNDLFCKECSMQETLWVCLTCGFVGCGRYSHRHAAQHYEETGHPYSLELATLRIWDYAADGEFVQRGDLLECPSVQGHLPFEGQSLAHASTWSHDHYDTHSLGHLSEEANEKPPPKKANMIGEEYEALLQSALEDQAQHYEGEITRLRAELTAENVDARTVTNEEAREIDILKGDVARFRGEIDRLSRQLLDAQAQEAEYRADSQRLLREQQVSTDLLDKIREETRRENMEGRIQVDDLEQQVADLAANLKMRKQFSQSNELSNAQIFGTTSTPNPKADRKGKKTRRLFRK
mmetsp:Transcript_19867/g.36104  ORF Transcript_19867/g.36104 Transcript_19867/m.36104 type:complete len:577 (+) Transcript_19867:89-1819(+)|eukprot:CAMPEP_0202502310 /NCGR_PEP_ID=MMETSP1361-20130828/38598_1 /ASSEMBLY_ACC=CAM_ASM_000849 /TAXON_ID=210615 /ORGANISM="Staurosira complex sp., Strain CCMP2646" /LENGTH=576 /DNA_ID=CAMNT_0049135297 /DNA_START=101 /DNA_END=1831 /DNA_ORIENTATION=+